MTMTKEELPDLSWLEAYRTDSPNFGLERMERMLALRGNPHLQLSVIHIGGTNGKGSTIAHLRQLLEMRGLRVGTFTSPYLISYNEQIAINGRSIPNQDLSRLLETYRALFEEQANDEVLQGVTEFEIMTALAYDYLAQERVDVAIMEVGMGGLLDSTNVCRPDLTAITTIGLDHVALLGHSLAAIAEQKAGIVKQNVPLVTGRIEPEALAVIEDKAHQKQAPHYVYGQSYQVQSLGGTDSGEQFNFSNAHREAEPYQTPLLGQHQVDNAGLAIELCDLYCQIKQLPLLTKEQVGAALVATNWPGRMEQISHQPRILLDGAHNPHAMERLTRTLSQHYPDLDKKILFSCIQTKSLEEMVGQLKQLPKSQLILTNFADPRSFSKEKMEALAGEQGLDYADWQDFLEAYLKAEHRDDELLLITGSLYFLAQVRAYIIDKEKESRSEYGHEEN